MRTSEFICQETANKSGTKSNNVDTRKERKKERKNENERICMHPRNCSHARQMS